LQRGYTVAPSEQDIEESWKDCEYQQRTNPAQNYPDDGATVKVVRVG